MRAGTRYPAAAASAAMPSARSAWASQAACQDSGSFLRRELTADLNSAMSQPEEEAEPRRRVSSKSNMKEGEKGKGGILAVGVVFVWWGCFWGVVVE